MCGWFIKNGSLEKRLELNFKRKKSKGEWQLVGWYPGLPSGNLKTIETIPDIGIGATWLEMESAYVIKVSKTRLGYEFST